jgi:hypothetical protein
MVELAVTNRGVAPMRFGIGLRPWCPRRAQAIVNFAAAGHRSLGREGEALGPVLPPDSYASGAEVPRRNINQCHGGEAGRAQIDRPDHGQGIARSAILVMGKLMVHVPAPDLNTFCLEPQSNAPCGFDARAQGRTAPGVHIHCPRRNAGRQHDPLP